MSRYATTLVTQERQRAKAATQEVSTEIFTHLLSDGKFLRGATPVKQKPKMLKTYVTDSETGLVIAEGEIDEVTAIYLQSVLATPEEAEEILSMLRFSGALMVTVETFEEKDEQ